MKKVIRITKITTSAAGDNKGCPNPSEPRVYFWPEGESIVDNLTNRGDRPYKAYKEIMPVIIDKLDIKSWTGQIRVQWSYRAGCSCRCSPGIILNGAQSDDLHVTYETVDGDRHHFADHALTM